MTNASSAAVIARISNMLSVNKNREELDRSHVKLRKTTNTSEISEVLMC